MSQTIEAKHLDERILGDGIDFVGLICYVDTRRGFDLLK